MLGCSTELNPKYFTRFPCYTNILAGLLDQEKIYKTVLSFSFLSQTENLFSIVTLKVISHTVFLSFRCLKIIVTTVLKIYYLDGNPTNSTAVPGILGINLLKVQLHSLRQR